MTLWLYVSLGRCLFFDKRYAIFASDAFGSLVLTTMAASVHSRVSVAIFLSFFYKFQLE